MPDRQQAAKAATRLSRVRTARAELKAKIKTGEIDWEAVMRGNAGHPVEQLITTMRVLTFLRAIPGIGELTAYDLLSHLGIIPTMRFTGMTMELRAKLAEMTAEVVG